AVAAAAKKIRRWEDPPAEGDKQGSLKAEAPLIGESSLKVEAEGIPTRVNKRAPGMPARLRFSHGAGTEFDLNEESAGTRAWLSMLPAILDALDVGAVYVVDEIDTSLHPELTARLVGLFQSTDLNPHNAQLVFTTHDV